MAYLPQIWPLLHGSNKPLFSRVRRTVVDVNDFIDPSTIEGGGNLGDQRRYILGLVAHGNNDGNGRLSCVRRGQIYTHR